MADPAARQPEGVFVIQTALTKAGEGVMQVRFQLALLIGCQARLRGQFFSPPLNGVT